ncbi:MAG: GLPGLI family protein [Moheibacter sp.]
MRTIINILFFALFINLFAQDTDVYRVEFIKYFQIDNDKFEQYNSNVTDRDVVAKNKEVLTRIDNYTLICDDKEAAYNKEAKLDNSPLGTLSKDDDGSTVTFHNNSGLILYRNLEKKFSLVPNEKKTMVQDSLPQFDWNTNYSEEKEILGYKVKKATAKGLEPDTEMTVWYTPEIPYSQGPYLYWGLPGLILKIDIQVNSEQGMAYYINSYHFDAKKIEKITDDNSLLPKVKKVISRDEYNASIKEFERKKKEYNSQGVDVD